jgi:hypothetical protein
MPNRTTFKGQLAGAVALALATMLACAGIALAAKQVKGATYVGHYKGASQVGLDAIAFKVSANGRKLTFITVETPIKCNGGCGGVGTPKGGTATIKRNGTFEAKLKIPAPGPGGKAEGTVTVIGTFHAHGKASGTVTSHFNGGGGGATRDWTAVG